MDHLAALMVATGRGYFLVQAEIKEASTSARSTSGGGSVGKCSKTKGCLMVHVRVQAFVSTTGQIKLSSQIP